MKNRKKRNGRRRKRMEIRKRRRRQKRKKGGREKEELCWLMRDIKATPLLTIDQFMRCRITDEVQNCSLTFCYSQIDTTFGVGHRISTEEAIVFSNAIPSSALPV
jgi:hypothetical protein